jgi:hypothetical protein
MPLVRTFPWRGALVPPAAVLIVHGTNAVYPLIFDDYFWLAVPDHPGWLRDVTTLGSGASIYRPGLALWFAAMRPLFGTSALPYHLFALGFLIAAALAVRWLGLELGFGKLAATGSGIVYGAFAPLSITTMWVSAAGSSLAVALAVASVALVCRPSARRHVLAATLLAAGILVRDATVVTPAVASVVLFARSPDWTGLKTTFQRTWMLWLVAGAFLTARMVLFAQGANSGPYEVDIFGGHVARNLLDLMQEVSWLSLRGALFDEIHPYVIRAWNVSVWLGLIGAAFWALRRRNYLALAGIGWFFIALLPVVGLPNHAMEPYYLDVAAVGLAVTVGSFIAMVRPSPAVLVSGLVAFVLVQAVAVQVFQNGWESSEIVRRAVALEQIASTERPRSGELVVATHCPRDRIWSRNGDLFRVLEDDPDLEVRFETLQPETCG